MSMTAMETASFDELVKFKIRLRREGHKDGVRYANVESVLKRRFGRS